MIKNCRSAHVAIAILGILVTLTSPLNGQCSCASAYATLVNYADWDQHALRDWIADNVKAAVPLRLGASSKNPFVDLDLSKVFQNSNFHDLYWKLRSREITLIQYKEGVWTVTNKRGTPHELDLELREQLKWIPSLVSGVTAGALSGVNISRYVISFELRVWQIGMRNVGQGPWHLDGSWMTGLINLFGPESWYMPDMPWRDFSCQATKPEHLAEVIQREYWKTAKTLSRWHFILFNGIQRMRQFAQIPGLLHRSSDDSNRLVGQMQINLRSE